MNVETPSKKAFFVSKALVDGVLNSKTRISTFKRAGIQGLEYAIEVHGRYTAKEAFELTNIYKEKRLE